MLKILAVSVLALTVSAEVAAAQTRTFACGKGSTVTLTITGPDTILAGPIEGQTLRLKQNPQNPLQFFEGDYAVTITPDQTEITVAIPDFGTVKCAFQPQAAGGGTPGIGPTDPCGPGFRQAPQTDRCDPVPGNTDPNSRPARRTGTAEGRFPMEGQSLGGIMRNGPSLSAARIASIGEGNTITILARDVDMDGYSWFRIRYQGRTGFQWGGIMCSQNPIRGIFQQCEP